MEYQPEEFKGICDFCLKKGKKAYKETNYVGITLLSPMGKWICESCLVLEKRKIVLGANI